MLKASCKISAVRELLSNRFSLKNSQLEKDVFGLHFINPVGLGAGFDKNARYLRELATLGFGFIEIGTVTPKPQAGNDKPRLFRLPADKALINRMGFNNDGVEVIARRLAEWKERSAATTSGSVLIGGNIGKNKVTENEDAWKDYLFCFDRLFEVADYFVVNVSSPNTPGLRALQEREPLKKILSSLQEKNQTKNRPKPLLLKIAPDLSNEQLDDIVSLAAETQLSGLVATNTTISREGLLTPQAAVEAIGMGGLSGKPVKQRATAVLEYLHRQTGGQLPIIASGGIFNGADAREKLEKGASLIQVWTGFIYEGPGIASDICRYLLNPAK